MDNQRHESGLIRRSHHPNHRKIRKSSSDIESALDYLKNPTGHGLWKASFEWKSGKGIIKYIQDSTLRKIDKDYKDADDEIKENRLRRAQMGFREIESVGFVLRLFLFLHQDSLKDENEGVRPQYSPAEDYYSRLLTINYAGVGRKYKEALDFFGKKIYHGSFSGYAGRRYSGIKSGNFVITDEPNNDIRKETRTVEISAVDEQPLLDLCHFLSLVEIIEDEQIYTVFSPEDELLSPYVEITGSMLGTINVSPEMKQQFEKMVADYESENFTGCVATAGLVAEECLIQIYETLARKPCPPRQTLGDLSKKIGYLSRDLLSPRGETAVAPPNRKEVMRKINALGSVDLEKKVAYSINTVLEYVDKRDAETQFTPDTMRTNDKDYDYRLFPSNIKMSLDNLISYRNNSLHKSTVIIGSLEALKSVHGSLCLLLWWNGNKKNIKATTSPQDVLKNLIEMNAA